MLHQRRDGSCIETDHVLKDCHLKKCWKYGQFGHKGKECNKNEICNLCCEDGHTYFTCPKAYGNKLRGRPQFQEDQQDENFLANLPPIEDVLKWFHADNDNIQKENGLQNDEGPNQETHWRKEQDQQHSDEDDNRTEDTKTTTSSYEDFLSCTTWDIMKARPW